MPTAFQKFKRVVFVVYLIAVHAALIFFAGDYVLRRYTSILPVENASVRDPNTPTVIPTPLPVPESFADPVNSNTNTETAPHPTAELIIPVAGVTRQQLIDTFSSTRSEDRYHDAIDIPAPAGTPVIAATDGEIARFFDSERGGITIYQITADRKFVLYYAHLQRRADEISVGMTVKKGATIGYVGDTGNAGPRNYHLHFSIALINDPKRFWEGTYINPYPLLKSGTYPQIP